MATKTPLALVRGLGAARSGTDEFWRQRLSAVALLPLAAFFIGLLVALAGASHHRVATTLGDGWVAVPLLLLVVACLVHMKIGVQVVIEDYVHDKALKLVLLMANTFFSYAMAIAAAAALVKLSLGG
ncbi:MAG TPA: succinate dehydrogenase, hydrophobic membrane anchor protein [Hyphomicrobiales bacterium]|nr:succinate dehydrogenase, hydrophobic membrane anchor protein [Hyphomicrobiales bacterium]